jgi:hypothetical protein
MRGPETRLRLKMEKSLKAEFPQCLFLKIHGNQFQNIGIPDMLCCVKGRFVALEVKTARGKVSLAQQLMMKRIQKALGVSAVVRTVEEALETVRTAIKRPLGPQQIAQK